jgi:hypothetical protein
MFPFFMKALPKSTLNFKCDIVSTNLLNQLMCLNVRVDLVVVDLSRLIGEIVNSLV